MGIDINDYTGDATRWFLPVPFKRLLRPPGLCQKGLSWGLSFLGSVIPEYFLLYHGRRLRVGS